MIETSDFFYLGKVVKTHGIEGELSGFVEADDPLVYSSLHGAFIKTRQGLLPFIFEQFTIDNRGYFLLKIKGIDLPEEAGRFVNKEIYLPLDMLPKLSGNKFYFHEVQGFKVVDQHHGFIGTITGVIEHTAQVLLQIEFQGKEILLPVHDDILLLVDRESKSIQVNTPEGLIDIYMKE
jgi:16S rRNA processing protein RimM